MGWRVRDSFFFLFWRGWVGDVWSVPAVLWDVCGGREVWVDVSEVSGELRLVWGVLRGLRKVVAKQDEALAGFSCFGEEVKLCCQECWLPEEAMCWLGTC